MLQPSDRFLATIVSLDLYGYSRLTELDEIGIHRALMACLRTQLEPHVQDRGGAIVKSTGDGALIRFPSAQQAVQAMVRFQRDVTVSEARFPESRRLVFRVGIHLGPLILEDGDVFGHGVNVAVRLQEAAEPGSIFLSDTVVRHLDSQASSPLRRIGKRALKNMTERTTIYGWWADGQGRKYHPRPLGRLVAALLLINMILPMEALNTVDAVHFENDSVSHQDIDRPIEHAFEADDQVKPYHGFRGGPLKTGVNATMFAAERAIESRQEIAEDAYLQARAFYGRHTPKAFAEAITLLDSALILKPDNSAAHALLAALYWGAQQNRWQVGQGMTRTAMQKRARTHLGRATASSSLVHMVRSEMLTANGRHDRAIVVAKRALRIDPKDAAGHYALGQALLFAGRALEAEAPIRAAIRLDPNASRYLFGLALAQFSMNHFDAAERTLALATSHNDRDDWPYLLMAATQGHLGLTTKAREAIGRFDRLSLARRGWFASQIPYVYSLPFRDKSDQERLHLGMVLAGIPEVSR